MVSVPACNTCGTMLNVRSVPMAAPVPSTGTSTVRYVRETLAACTPCALASERARFNLDLGTVLYSEEF